MLHMHTRVSAGWATGDGFGDGFKGTWCGVDDGNNSLLSILRVSQSFAISNGIGSFGDIDREPHARFTAAFLVKEP